MSLDYQQTAIIDPSYFQAWKQYALELANGNRCVFRRVPEPLKWVAPRISTANNVPQYDRNLLLCEDSDVSYQYIVDIYIGVHSINYVLSGEGIFDGGVEPTVANVQGALENNWCQAAPNPKGNMPWLSKPYLGQNGEYPFWVPTDEDLGKHLATEKEIADGSPIGWRSQGSNGYYYPLLPVAGSDSGALTAQFYRFGPPPTNAKGIFINGNGQNSNELTISAGIIDYLPIPGSPLQERGLNWLVPKLFTPYIFFGYGVIAVMWIGLKQNGAGAGSELEGANWYVRKQLCWGMTPSAPYNHFFPCYHWKGLCPTNMMVDIAMEQFALLEPILGKGGSYIGKDKKQVMFTITGEDTDATLTFTDGTIYEHMDLTSTRAMMNSPATPTTKGTNFPEPGEQT